MILNPAIIALILSSLLSAWYAVYASVTGWKIIRGWDIDSGNEQQLILERKTYLISTVLTLLFGLSGITLLLFVHTAENIHPFFVGAMCAAGSLNVNKYGYPALINQITVIFICGVWLLINFIDTRAPDYPLIRIKYKLLFFIAVLLVCNAYLVSQYFLHMKANVITSCCGVLFSENARGLAGGVASFPLVPAKILFYLSAIFTIRAGIHFYMTGRSANVFALLSAWMFSVSIFAIISFFSVYFYEQPTHHCPFCLLQKEYGYIGYPLYISLFVGGIAGVGVGVLERLKGPASLENHIPDMQKKLCLLSVAGFVLFTLLATYPILFSDFRMEGY